MSANSKKITGAVVSLAMLGSIGFTAGVQAINAQPVADDVANAAAEENGATAQESALMTVSQVNGTFSYDQNVLSSNEDITNIFNKAAASMCSTGTSYGVSGEQQPISISGLVGNTISATVDDMASSAGAVAYTLACACATNIAGGGAMANALVEGVSFESIMEAANVQ